MQIYFTRKRIVKWVALCNSSVNDKSPYSDYDEGVIINMPFVPQVGDYIFLNGERHKVCNVYIDLDRMKELGVPYKNEKDAEMMHKNIFIPITVEYDAKFLHIPYYDYMKAFTHSEDGMKSRENPTRLANELASNYKIVLPNTFEDWEEDLKILNGYDELNDGRKVVLSYTRCKLK